MQEAGKETAREHSMQPLLLTVEDASKVLGVSRSKMYEMVAAGEVRSIKIGRMRRVPRKILDEYVERKINEATA
jgi:excisionase family DNA binding protein